MPMGILNSLTISHHLYLDDDEVSSLDCDLRADASSLDDDNVCLDDLLLLLLLDDKLLPIERNANFNFCVDWLADLNFNKFMHSNQLHTHIIAIKPTFFRNPGQNKGCFVY